LDVLRNTKRRKAYKNTFKNGIPYQVIIINVISKDVRNFSKVNNSYMDMQIYIKVLVHSYVISATNNLRQWVIKEIMKGDMRRKSKKYSLILYL